MNSPPAGIGNVRVSMIVAVAENGIIGRDGTLPWRLSADLKRFKRLTMGHALLMGRKTFDSIGRPLPGRRSIVLSRDTARRIDGCHVIHDWNQLAAAANGESDVFVIGGHQVFQDALPFADRLFWTQVHANVNGDVAFPEVAWKQWQLVAEERHEADERNQFAYSFRDYERK